MAKMSLGLILSVISGCSGGFTSSSSVADQSAPDGISSSWTSYSITSASDLPACGSETQGRLYYIETEKSFRVCKSTGWTNIVLKGADGANGANGTNGSNGTDAPRYRIHDGNDIVLPGVVAQLGSGSLWHESEGTTTSYYCNPTCGMVSLNLYYTSTNCTGTTYVPNTSNISNSQSVFMNTSDRWKVTGQPMTVTAKSIYAAGVCTTIGGAGSTLTLSEVAHYAGDFPMSPPGPYRVVKE